MASQSHVKNLGVALSLLMQQTRNEAALYEDLEAFHAPGECYPLVERRIERDRAAVARRVKDLTGLRVKAVVREAARRTSARCVHYTLGL